MEPPNDALSEPLRVPSKADQLIDRAATAAQGLSADEVADLVTYLLWIAHFRKDRGAAARLATPRQFGR